MPASPRSRPLLRTLAQLALALVLGVGLATAAGACGDDATVIPPEADSSDEASSVSRDDCPTTAPVNGSVCLLPEGTTCDFGLCGTRLARCTQGAWQTGSNARPSPPCPEDPPSADIACPACWPVSVSCTYGSTNCAAKDASLNTATASCPSGKWILDIRPCRDGGGPDVQGDGGPEAD